jgi:hypothetical protein
MFFDSLTNKEKKVSIETSMAHIKLELYRLVNEAGIDPVTFNIETFNFDSNNIDTPNYSQYKEISNNILKLKNLIKRLNEIN